MPEPFEPYSPEIARMLASKAAELYKASPVFRTKNANPCAICVHDNREEIDYQLLIGAKGPALRQAAGRDPSPDGPDRGRWAVARFIAHRDKHLMPLVRTGVSTALTKIAQMPFPDDGTTKDRGLWFLFRNFMLHEEALAQRKFTAALLALKEMRQIDLEIQGIQNPADRAPLPLDLEDVDSPTLSQDEKLQAAFARSRPKQPIDDEDGDGRDANVGNGPSPEAPR